MNLLFKIFYEVPLTYAGDFVMNSRVRRYRLTSKESKKIIREVLEKIPTMDNIFTKRKVSLEVIDLESAQLYLYEGIPTIVRKEGFFVPFIERIIDSSVKLPNVVVDLGAVKFIAKGADVMGPGIVEADEEVSENRVVSVVDEKYKHPIAVGIALRDSRRIKTRGKSVKNIHHVNDKIWKFIKSSL